MTDSITYRYDLMIGNTKIYTRKQKDAVYVVDGVRQEKGRYTHGLVNACNPTKILNMTRSQFAKSLLEPYAGYAPFILPVEWVDDTRAVLRLDIEGMPHLNSWLNGPACL